MQRDFLDIQGAGPKLTLAEVARIKQGWQAVSAWHPLLLEEPI
jgi:hypothetical protein